MNFRMWVILITFIIVLGLTVRGHANTLTFQFKNDTEFKVVVIVWDISSKLYEVGKVGRPPQIYTAELSAGGEYNPPASTHNNKPYRYIIWWETYLEPHITHVKDYYIKIEPEYSNVLINSKGVQKW